MVFETSQESCASAIKDVEPLCNQIKFEDIRAYNSDKLNQGRGCTGFLPDCTVDFDKHGVTAATDKCFPIRIGIRRPEDGLSEPIDEIRDLLFGSSYYNLQAKVSRAAEREAVSKLSPEDQKKYQQEKEAMEEYQRHRSMLACLIDFDDPPPVTPTMDKVNKRAHEIEQQARDHVLAHMTPEERKQYEEEQRKYNDYSDWDRIPITATVYRPAPTPGPMMREVERRTAGAIRSRAYTDQPVVVCKAPQIFDPRWDADELLI